MTLFASTLQLWNDLYSDLKSELGVNFINSIEDHDFETAWNHIDQEWTEKEFNLMQYVWHRVKSLDPNEPKQKYNPIITNGKPIMENEIIHHAMDTTWELPTAIDPDFKEILLMYRLYLSVENVSDRILLPFFTVLICRGKNFYLSPIKNYDEWYEQRIKYIDQCSRSDKICI